MKFLGFLLSSLLILPLTSFASGGMGNGGDAIVCPDRVILLDSYEAEKMRLTIDLTKGNPNPTLRSMVNVSVSRLSRVDKVTSSLLYDYAMEMVNDFEKFEMHPGSRGRSVYLGYDVIAEINDSFHVSTPEGCEEHPRQLVSQKVPRFNFEFRYQFNKSLWERMELQEQAMTVLHEAWYRIMLENGAVESRSARYMNALTASQEFELLTFSDYMKELVNTELKYFIIQNKSESFKASEIKINLKDHKLNYYSDMVCAPNFKLNMSFKETFTVFNQSQSYLKNTKFKEVCFKGSTVSELRLYTKLPSKGITLRLPFHQLQFKEFMKMPQLKFFVEDQIFKIIRNVFLSIIEIHKHL